MIGSAWTDERVQTLAGLWQDGLSASQIARVFATTRNAVIGKIHRMGLSRKAKPSAPVTGRKSARGSAGAPAARRTRPPSKRAPPACVVDREPADGLATVLSVRRGQCRWPIGEPMTEPFALCGRPAVRGAYCQAHAEIAYRPASKRPGRDHLLKLAGLA